jgi:hypothetical protein
MANSDKNIVITPNVGASADDPKIVFSGADSATGPQNITLKAYPTSNGTVSFEGSAGQLFSITNDLSGTIFSVNDVSGIPSIEVNADGTVKIAEYSGNVLIGTDTDNGTDKLQINGSISATTFTGAVTGNATTATTLATARTIGGVSFNGSANIDLPGVNTAGNQNTSGSAATLTTARTIGGVSFNGSANINLPGVNTAGNQNTSGTAAVSTAATITTSDTASAFKVPFSNTTASTTGNYGLLQDSTATFTYNPNTNTLAVGTVSGALSGNATTATTLQTARTIGGVSFNGSANINLPGVNTAGNQNTTGSAATLTTARTIGGVSFNGSADIDLPGVNTTGNQNTTGSAATLTTARTINGVSFNGSANITVADATKMPLTGGTMTGQLISTRANSTATGGGQIYLNGTTGNRIDFNTSGVAAPTFTTRSAGTKLVLYPNVTASAVDFALGIETNTLWYSVASTSNQFKWYGGTSVAMTLTGAGVLTATTFTGALSGNATTATTLQTARTIALGGDVTGSASFNGSANITITATVADDSHNHVISNVDGLQTALDAKLALAGGTMTGNVRGSVHTASVTGTVTVNLTTYNSFVYTLTGNITLANPTTEGVGQSGVFVFIHSGAARTVSLGTDFETVGGGGLTLSSASGATDIVPYFVSASGRIILGTPQLAFS